MKMKLLGYGLSVIGLGLIVVSAESVYSTLPLSFIPAKSILLVGVGVIAVSVIFLMDKSGKKKKPKTQQSKEEVPIYEGEGKNRKIVGYQRDE